MGTLPMGHNHRNRRLVKRGLMSRVSRAANRLSGQTIVLLPHKEEPLRPGQTIHPETLLQELAELRRAYRRRM